jgi:hypothetical protein
MSDVREVLILPTTDGGAEAPIDDDAALEAALAELARGFVRLRVDGR